MEIRKMTSDESTQFLAQPLVAVLALDEPREPGDHVRDHDGAVAYGGAPAS
ncbi:hypothetical protein [Tenggerimyces flavus]|uniref:Uncharacterized protein n=1 Tax=Tenggerimyces flavus TaxID=1708749 RepID=A0ABV7YEB4_9ACTN|nr:hypothetical protein [Tenggerimyces flavus]MBM7786896.1 hypothetical protein [Tenggerimyces flavus]